MGVAAVRGHVDVADFDSQQPRIRHLEADELDQFLSHRFRYSPDSTFVHMGFRISDVGFREYRQQHPTSEIRHPKSIYAIHSTTAPTNCGPRTSEASCSTVCKTRSPWLRSAATVTAATRARC